MKRDRGKVLFRNFNDCIHRYFTKINGMNEKNEHELQYSLEIKRKLCDERMTEREKSELGKKSTIRLGFCCLFEFIPLYFSLLCQF